MLKSLADAMNKMADAMDRLPHALGKELHTGNEMFIAGLIVGVVAVLLLIEILGRKR